MYIEGYQMYLARHLMVPQRIPHITLKPLKTNLTIKNIWQKQSQKYSDNP